MLKTCKNQDKHIFEEKKLDDAVLKTQIVAKDLSLIWIKWIFAKELQTPNMPIDCKNII